jgi:hypothetical protein
MNSTIELLRSTKEQTLPCFDLDEKKLTMTYAPGKWTAKEILHHLADAETVLYDRIRRAISEGRPVVWAFDQDAWCNYINYKVQPLWISKAIYASVRDGVINLAEQYYEVLGKNEFIHSETGVRTLKDEIDKVANHNLHHLNQIKAALESFPI